MTVNSKLFMAHQSGCCTNTTTHRNMALGPCYANGAGKDLYEIGIFLYLYASALRVCTEMETNIRIYVCIYIYMYVDPCQKCLHIWLCYGTVQSGQSRPASFTSLKAYCCSCPDFWHVIHQGL